MTTKEAFVKLISERGIYKQLGVTKGYIGSVKDLIKKKDKYPSVEVMEKMLEKAGFVVVQEKLWKPGKELAESLKKVMGSVKMPGLMEQIEKEITIPEMKKAIQESTDKNIRKWLKNKKS